MNILSCKYHTQYVAMILGLVFSLTLSGCASKFFKTKSVNLTPFAKQTIQMIGTLHYGLKDSEILYLRGIENYIEKPEPFKRYFALEEQVVRMLKGIVAYSLQVVTISEQNIPVEKKNQALANMILELRDYISENAVIQFPDPETQQHLIDSVEKMKTSETYIQALQHAQILINSFNAHAGQVLDELKREKTHVAKIIDKAIDNKYAVSVEFEKELRKIRHKYYTVLILLSRYVESRDKKHVAQIRKLDIYEVNAIIKNRTTLDRKDIPKIHAVVTERLTMLNKNQEQVRPDIKLYHKAHLELDHIIENKANAIKDARLTFVLWSQAHSRMAAGKTDPAEWFDVTETGSLLFGAAQRAAGL